jgi:hypothetical protein
LQLDEEILAEGRPASCKQDPEGDGQKEKDASKAILLTHFVIDDRAISRF